MRLESVAFRYHRRSPWVLRDVTLTLPPGQITEVTGRNGAGKSTLLRIIAGLRTPTRGTVTDRPPRVGYAPERFPTDQPFTVRAYLTHMTTLHQPTRPSSAARLARTPRPGRTPRPVEAARPGEAAHPGEVTCPGETAHPGGTTHPGEAARPGEAAHPGGTARLGEVAGLGWVGVVERLGLTGLLDTKLPDLSKGSAQKVGLAQALLGDPALLVLDEPFAGLDADTRESLPALLSELAAAGTSIVVSDHQRVLDDIPRVRVSDGTVSAADPVSWTTLEVVVRADEADALENELRAGGHTVRRPSG